MITKEGRRKLDLKLKQFRCLECGKLVYPNESHEYKDCQEFKKKKEKMEERRRNHEMSVYVR